jgi:ABC-type antimicrobial peptide transport system permease subunit
MESSKENNVVLVHENTQGPLAEAMKKDLPEVESSTLVFSLAKEGLIFNLKTPDKTLKAEGVFAGKDFFNVFTFPLLSGRASSALQAKKDMAISANLARNLFGSETNAIGKSIEFEITGMKRICEVSAVFKNPPANSSMQFDFALSQDMLINDLWTNGQVWTNEGPSTYLLLKPGTDVASFNHKIKDYLKGYFKETQFSLFVRPYADAYLYGTYENGKQAGGRISYVKLFSFVALFILIIACINFMNLSTARASRRMKEVGIKKTMGSSRRALAFQFLAEAIMMAFLSFLVACVMVVLLLPAFNDITGKTLTVTFDLTLMGYILVAVLLTGLLAGSYPAFYLSGFKTVNILKGNIKNPLAELLARKGLVVFQFIVSLVLIISVLVIHQQVSFIQDKKLGYDRDQVIYFDKEGTVFEHSDAFLAELKKMPGIINASAIQQNIVQTGNSASTYDVNWPGKNAAQAFNFMVRNVDIGLFETLGIQLKEGRFFSQEFGQNESSLIFNETAIKMMGLTNPIGTKIAMWGKEMQIAGVVKDFHFSSLHEAIAPMLFRYDPGKTALIMAKIEAGKEKATLAKLEDFYKKYNPGYALNYKFLDAAYQAQYVSEQRVSTLSTYFALLAILISCLGLFGLAAFNAEVRFKEIGIRKVLGATAGNLVYLLSKDFFKLVMIAVLISFPIAWWAMSSWLNGFAYKVNLQAAVFLVALIVISVLTFLTVGFQALKAAIANPVKNLRTQ